MTRQLKSDLLNLQQVFTENHDQFRVLNASVDELTCRFILKNKTFFDIQAIITDLYPSDSPFWIVLSEDETVIDLMEKPLETFNNTQGHDNHIVKQVIMMVNLLCRIHDEPLPEKLNELSNPNSILERDDDTGNESDDVSDESEDEDEEVESDAESVDDVFYVDEKATSNPTEIEIHPEMARIIRKQKNLQYGKQSVGSNSRNKVLLNELDNIYRSEMYKNNTYSVELSDDSLEVWNVHLMSVCPDSLLHSDLNRLKEQGLSGSIQMRITFEETFPYSPPFVQVTYPAILGGHVLDQGALCMELLTTDGWSSVYAMENVLMQILSTLVTGNARVDFEKTQVILRMPYSQEKARKMFAYHADLHKKNGWTLPAPRNS